MTLEEFRALSAEDFDDFHDENEEEYDELMAAAFAEANENHKGDVFECDCAYFIITHNDVREISDDASCSPKGGWFPDIIIGPSDEEKQNVKKLMKDFDFDEYIFSDISDDSDFVDWDSDEIAEYLEDLDAEDEEEGEIIKKINTIFALQKAVEEKKIPFDSVNDIYMLMKTIDLDSDTRYYEWEGEFIDLYENIDDCGEPRGTYEDIDDYEWLNMLQHLDDYRV